MKKVIDFWKHGYESDRVSFCLEMCSFFFVVGASMFLSLTADAPRMEYIYPLFFLGSCCSIVAYLRRRLAWQLITVVYFQFVNLFGFGRALGWW